MSKGLILMVDDEPDLIWAVQNSLTRAGFEVISAANGAEALAICNRQRPDLVLLDISIPPPDGLEVCRRIREDSTLAAMPIIFLTSRKAIQDRIEGLDDGGDDYMAKPFDLRELQARINALLRRGHLNPASDEDVHCQGSLIKAGSISLDVSSRQVWVGMKKAELTATEFDLLYFLLTHTEKIFSSQQLLQQVWNYPLETADIGLVRWHVKNLRLKIEADPTHPVHLVTVTHQGYILKRKSMPNALLPDPNARQTLISAS